MSDQGILDRVRKVVADVTHSSLEDVNERTSSRTLEGWDSVAQINVIIGIESEFGVSFDVEEMYSLDSVEKIRSTVQERVGNSQTLG